MKRILITAAMALTSTVALAKDLPTAPYLPLDMATTAAQKALEACSEKGWQQHRQSFHISKHGPRFSKPCGLHWRKA